MCAGAYDLDCDADLQNLRLCAPVYKKLVVLKHSPFSQSVVFEEVFFVQSPTCVFIPSFPFSFLFSLGTPCKIRAPSPKQHLWLSSSRNQRSVVPILHGLFFSVCRCAALLSKTTDEFQKQEFLWTISLSLCL